MSPRQPSAPSLVVTTEAMPAAYVVRLQGDGDHLAATDLERRLTPLMAARPACVVLDLAGVGLVSSLVLGVLVSFRRGVARHGGRVFLVAVPAHVRETLEVTRLTELFEMAGCVEEAIG